MSDPNPDFIALTHSLAVFYFDAGQPRPALALHQRCFHLASSFGMQEWTLTSEACLAEVYVALGMRQQALQCALSCARGRTRLLGPQHPLTLESLRLLTLVGEG